MIELRLKDTFEQPYLMFPSKWTMAQAIDWAIDRNIEGEWITANKAHYGLFVTSPVQVHQIDDKEATVPAVDTKQAAPEFESWAVGDLVQTGWPELVQGYILEVSKSGFARCKSHQGMIFFRDLSALTNLSRKDQP